MKNVNPQLIPDTPKFSRRKSGWFVAVLVRPLVPLEAWAAGIDRSRQSLRVGSSARVVVPLE